jgi:tetratricopeptide (TPR) repeat protein
MSQVKALLDKAREALIRGDEKAAGLSLSEVVAIARQAWDMGDITTSEAIFRQVLILKPDNAEALFGLAELYRRTNPIMAVEYYTRYILNHPGDPAAYYGRGSCYLAREAYSLAIQDLETLINRLEPNNVGGLTNLALAYRGRAIEQNYDPDLFKKAVDTMQLAVTAAQASDKEEIKKLLPELKYRLGRLIFEYQQIIAKAQSGKADFSEAIQSLEESIQESQTSSLHNLDDAQAINQMVLSYDALSEIYQAQSQLDPNNSTPYMELAAIAVQRTAALARQSQIAALGYVKKALEVDPAVAKNWATLADLYAQLGNVDEAINAIDKAIKLEPDNAALKAARKKWIASTQPTTQPKK